MSQYVFLLPQNLSYKTISIKVKPSRLICRRTHSLLKSRKEVGGGGRKKKKKPKLSSSASNSNNKNPKPKPTKRKTKTSPVSLYRHVFQGSIKFGPRSWFRLKPHTRAGTRPCGDGQCPPEGSHGPGVRPHRHLPSDGVRKIQRRRECKKNSLALPIRKDLSFKR